MNIDINNLPEEITMDLVLVVTEFGWLKAFNADDGSVIENHTKLTNKTTRVTFKIGSIKEIKGGVVDKLKAESKKIRADAEVKCKRIDDKINSLLAIESD